MFIIVECNHPVLFLNVERGENKVRQREEGRWKKPQEKKKRRKKGKVRCDQAVTWVIPRVGLRGSSGDAELKKQWLEALMQTHKTLLSTHTLLRVYRRVLTESKAEGLLRETCARFYSWTALDIVLRRICKVHRCQCFSYLCHKPLLYIHCYTRSMLCPGLKLYIFHVCSETDCRG